MKHLSALSFKFNLATSTFHVLYTTLLKASLPYTEKAVEDDPPLCS